MGRRDKKYSIDLKQQIYRKLTDMLRAGEGNSKKEAIKNGTEKDKIFSYNTYQTYWQHCKYFANYINQYHPECTTLKSAKKYVNEWLNVRVNQVDSKGQHLSAWTIQVEAKALGKLYGIQPDDPKYFVAPKRKREDIKRSRGPAVRDKHFSELNNYELVNFCKGTGCRRNILEKLTGRDLYTRQNLQEEIDLCCVRGEECEIEVKKNAEIAKEALINFPDVKYFVHHRSDKGGRDRYAPIVGANWLQIVERMMNTKEDDRVWKYVPENADIHDYRGKYATEIYKKYARKIEDIPYDAINKGTGKMYQSGVYTCRKDEAGKKLDKDAMYKASKALGHNRLEIVANNYIRGL